MLASHVFDRETVLVGHSGGAALLLAILDEAGDSSIVYLLETNAKRLLFTGDIEEAVARRLAASWRGGPVDVFLATHHGSEKGSVAELLAKIDPACAVVSVGKGHGHPTIGAMQRLHAAGANIWCTARNGSMTATVRRDGIDWRAQRRRPQREWWLPTEPRSRGKCVDDIGAEAP